MNPAYLREMCTRLTRASSFRVAGLVFAVGLSLAACDDDDDRGGPATVSSMTLAQVEQRVIAAMFPHDAVMRTREFRQFPEGPAVPPLDIWRNAGAGEARVEGHRLFPTLYAQSHRFEIRPDGAIEEEISPVDSTNDELLGETSAFLGNASDALAMLIDVNGQGAIRIPRPGTCIDYCGPDELYVSADDFLPIQTDDGSVRFEHERANRDDLASDFFSVEALRDTATNLPSPPDIWSSEGHAAYWLGAKFEGLLPRAWFPEYRDSDFFSVRYAAPSSVALRNEPCLTIRHEREIAPSGRRPAVEQIATIQAPIGEVEIYRHYLHPNNWAAVHHLRDGSVVAAVVQCPAYGTDLESLDGVMRVANALRVYDGPARMDEFNELSTETP